MSDLDQVRGFIAQGDKEKAVVQLASILMENKHDVEAWLLLGEIIDDPSKKKDCYQWVLRLSPDHTLALTKLQELEPPSNAHQMASAKEAETGTKRPLNKSRQNSNYLPNPNLFPAVDHPNDDTEIISYFVLGVVAFLAILYVIVTGNFSGYSNIFCVGLFLLSISTGIIILLVVNKNRG